MPGLVTITIPPVSARLTSLANAKAEINITSTTDDTYIGSLIDRASGLIARRCGRVFGLQTASEIFRFGWQPGIGPSAQAVAPYGTPLAAQFKPLVLSHSPIIVASVVAVENGTTLTVGTDYEIDGGAGLAWRLRAGLRSFWGVPACVVTYQTGWTLPEDSPVSGVPTLPADVESVCLALVTAGYTNRGANPAVMQEQVEGVGRTIYQRGVGLTNMAIDADMLAALADYTINAW